MTVLRILVRNTDTDVKVRVQVTLVRQHSVNRLMRYSTSGVVPGYRRGVASARGWLMLRRIKL